MFVNTELALTCKLHNIVIYEHMFHVDNIINNYNCTDYFHIITFKDVYNNTPYKVNT